MRTTLTIADELLAAAKARAQATGRTVSAVVEAALRRELAAGGASPVAPAVPVFSGGTGPAPGLDLTSNAALLDVLDEGLALSERR